MRKTEVASLTLKTKNPAPTLSGLNALAGFAFLLLFIFSFWGVGPGIARAGLGLLTSTIGALVSWRDHWSPIGLCFLGVNTLGFFALLL